MSIHSTGDFQFKQYMHNYCLWKVFVYLYEISCATND